MDLMKEVYKTELRNKIDAWEGLVAADFQYDPERGQLKEMMKTWLGEKLGNVDEKKLTTANRKYFMLTMTEIIYEDKVRPNLDEFIVIQ